MGNCNKCGSMLMQINDYFQCTNPKCGTKYVAKVSMDGSKKVEFIQLPDSIAIKQNNDNFFDEEDEDAYEEFLDYEEQGIIRPSNQQSQYGDYTNNTNEFNNQNVNSANQSNFNGNQGNFISNPSPNLYGINSAQSNNGKTTLYIEPNSQSVNIDASTLQNLVGIASSVINDKYFTITGDGDSSNGGEFVESFLPTNNDVVDTAEGESTSASRIVIKHLFKGEDEDIIEDQVIENNNQVVPPNDNVDDFLDKIDNNRKISNDEEKITTNEEYDSADSYNYDDLDDYDDNIQNNQDNQNQDNDQNINQQPNQQQYIQDPNGNYVDMANHCVYDPNGNFL